VRRTSNAITTSRHAEYSFRHRSVLVAYCHFEMWCLFFPGFFIPRFWLCRKQKSVSLYDFRPQMMHNPWRIFRIWYFLCREIGRYDRSSTILTVLPRPAFINSPLAIHLVQLLAIPLIFGNTHFRRRNPIFKTIFETYPDGFCSPESRSSTVRQAALVASFAELNGSNSCS
jgi:hypothetical protein